MKTCESHRMRTRTEIRIALHPFRITYFGADIEYIRHIKQLRGSTSYNVNYARSFRGMIARGNLALSEAARVGSPHFPQGFRQKASRSPASLSIISSSASTTCKFWPRSGRLHLLNGPSGH
jgi:hypothetical protein